MKPRCAVGVAPLSFVDTLVPSILAALTVRFLATDST